MTGLCRYLFAIILATCLAAGLAGCAGSGPNALPPLSTPESGAEPVPDVPPPDVPPPDVPPPALPSPEVTRPPEVVPVETQIEPERDERTTAAYWADNDEYRGQSGLAMVRADAAYALGVSGRDVVIGFMDTGLDASHAEFTDADIVLNDRTAGRFNSKSLKHGTGVASVAAGRRGAGGRMHGVAFNAKIAMFSIPLNDNGSLALNDTMLANAVGKLKDAGATIINQSWGYSSRVNPNLLQGQATYLKTIFPEFYAQMAAGGAVHVWAAGNKKADQVAINAGWPIFFPNLAGLSIAVVALAESGALGALSNQCGALKNHCLAAPGDRDTNGSFTRAASAGTNDRYSTVHGTSYAVPYVSGVLALMREAFGAQLSVAEYTTRLLATADKSGIYADSDIYGQGLVDARAALEPSGELKLPLPNGGFVNPRDNDLNVGLLPETLLQQLANEEIILLDGLDTPFRVPLLRPHHFTRRALYPSMGTPPTGAGASSPPNMQLSVHPLQLRRWDSVKLGQIFDQAATVHPFLANFGQAQIGLSGGVGNGWGERPHRWRLVALGAHASNNISHHAIDNHPPQDALALLVENNFAFKTAALQVQFGVLHEAHGLLGSAGRGGLNMGAGNSQLARLHYQHHIAPNTKLTGLLNTAYSQIVGGDNSFIKQSDNLQAYEMRLGLARHNWRLEIGQALHFVEGALRLSVPVRRQAGGGVVFANRQYALAPRQTPYGLWFTHSGKKLSWHVHWQQSQSRPSDINTALNLVWAF